MNEVAQLSSLSEHLVDSCIVELPLGTKAGDVITICWPTLEQSKHYDAKDTHDGVKRRRLNNNNGTYLPSPFKRNDTLSDKDELLLKITIPQNISTKRSKVQYITVHAPWLATNQAASTTLDSRQLRAIGIESSTGSRRSRRKRGEGSVTKQSCPIGNLHQVSVKSIPMAGTWEKQEGSAVVECEQVWDSARGVTACSDDERIDQYMDSLQPFQKAQFIQTLHQSNYDFDIAKQRMDRKTMQVEVDVGPTHKSETTWQKCDKPNVTLEGTPFTETEREIFNNAISAHQKQFTIIAKTVDTTVNRCLIHYYSRFKSGEDKGRYLELKKIWEQSDECEICGDGGEIRSKVPVQHCT